MRISYIVTYELKPTGEYKNADLDPCSPVIGEAVKHIEAQLKEKPVINLGQLSLKVEKIQSIAQR
ncbi:MAG: hypothetical protein OEW23_12915 [Candidatus Aminicenantes bacterium]|nr:hypothetical protein [Candidatus Aminicenantes bacterium]